MIHLLDYIIYTATITAYNIILITFRPIVKSFGEIASRKSEFCDIVHHDGAVYTKFNRFDDKDVADGGLNSQGEKDIILSEEHCVFFDKL